MSAIAALDLHRVTVPRAWLDYNDHMNVTWYTKVFDDAGEAFIREIGMGEKYTRERGGSWVVLEAHLCYLGEARLGDELRVAGQVLGHDAKRVHLFMEMQRGTDAIASCEQMIMHLDLASRRSAPFPAAVYEQLAALAAAHVALARPAAAGRVIGLPQPSD